MESNDIPEWLLHNLLKCMDFIKFNELEMLLHIRNFNTSSKSVSNRNGEIFDNESNFDAVSEPSIDSSYK